MGRLQHGAGHGVVDAAALSGLLRARHVHDFLLRMIHHAHAFLDTLRDDGARDQGTVRVEGLNPIIVDDAGLLGVRLADPHDRTAA